MGLYIFISAIWRDSERIKIDPEACFVEIKEYALHTFMGKRLFPIKIIKVGLRMIKFNDILYYL